MRGMIQSVEKSPNGLLVLNIGGIKFRCYQELEKLGAEKKDIVDYDAVHDNDPRFTGTIIWIRKVPQSQQSVKAFNMSRRWAPRTGAKGDPTGTNLYVLKQYFEQADEIPNGALKPVDVPHMRRCLKAGLIEVVGGRGGTLRLTESGRKALGRI